MLFFGNLLKESTKTTRLAKTAGSALNDVIVMLLGLTVGCSTQASEFLTMDTIKIFFLGALAFIIATASGVLFVKFFNLFLPKHKKINPLIGNAGVSAVPMAARISQNLGLEYDSKNYLLMHAMGPFFFVERPFFKNIERKEVSYGCDYYECIGICNSHCRWCLFLDSGQERDAEGNVTVSPSA